MLKRDFVTKPAWVSGSVMGLAAAVSLARSSPALGSLLLRFGSVDLIVVGVEACGPDAGTAFVPDDIALTGMSELSSGADEITATAGGCETQRCTTKAATKPATNPSISFGILPPNQYETR